MRRFSRSIDPVAGVLGRVGINRTTLQFRMKKLGIERPI
jgi:hypothetical protein